MTRRHVLLFGIAAMLVVFAIGALALWPRTSAINHENFAKIRNGMTLAEVEELLGGPARNESDLPDNFIRDAFVNPFAEKMEKGRVPAFDDKRWASKGYIVLVDFDESGKVIRQSGVEFNVDRSVLDKLRRLLHL